MESSTVLVLVVVVGFSVVVESSSVVVSVVVVVVGFSVIVESSTVVVSVVVVGFSVVVESSSVVVSVVVGFTVVVSVITEVESVDKCDVDGVEDDWVMSLYWQSQSGY